MVQTGSPGQCQQYHRPGKTQRRAAVLNTRLLSNQQYLFVEIVSRNRMIVLIFKYGLLAFKILIHFEVYVWFYKPLFRVKISRHTS